MDHKFKNIVTQRFHDYFYDKLKDHVLGTDKFFDDFGIQGSNKFQFFSGMRSGHRGVTPEQVQIAWDKYAVRPDYLFGIVDDPISILAEPAPTYAKSISTDISKIRKLLDEVEKKIKKP